VPDGPYRAPLPIEPPRRRPQWLRIAIASAVGLLFGVPIGAEIFDRCLGVLCRAFAPPLVYLGALLLLFGTPLVLGRLTHQALGRPKKHAIGFIVIAGLMALVSLELLGDSVSHEVLTHARGND
jgi:hypothetical protein